MSGDAAFALAAALPLAFALDRAFGEPRDRWHPVAWFGRALRPVGHLLRSCTPVTAFVAGAGAWLIACGAVAVLGWWAQRAALAQPAWLAAPLLALLLKPSFAWRMLRDEVEAVELAQGAGIDAARTRLARLVSRDVRAFDADDVRETAIETLAENLNDSLVAPLFWFVLFGLPGAWLYRAANTLDAMWGYRGTWEWAGKFAARADDVLSWAPARLTALWLAPFDLRALRSEARRTPSPNGGWPMGAMALRLGVRLRKPGVYALNGAAPSPTAPQFAQAQRLAARAAAMSIGLATFAWLARAALA